MILCSSALTGEKLYIAAITLMVVMLDDVVYTMAI